MVTFFAACDYFVAVSDYIWAIFEYIVAVCDWLMTVPDNIVAVCFSTLLAGPAPPLALIRDNCPITGHNVHASVVCYSVVWCGLVYSCLMWCGVV